MVFISDSNESNFDELHHPSFLYEPKLNMDVLLYVK